MTASALYSGAVTHRRLAPRAHALRYRCFWLLLDLAEIDDVARATRLFSRGRFNLFSFHDRDHGAGTDEPLRAQVDRHLASAGIDLAGGAVRLLCMPRVAGYVFNPLSIFFCHRIDGALAAIIYEVSNTFGERHSYLIPVRDSDADPIGPGGIRQTCDKVFYVSPFMDMDMSYEFRVAPPARGVSVVIRASRGGRPMLIAALAGRRSEITNATLLRAFLTQPAVTAKVVGAIHWEALKLWLKGVELRPRPAPPRDAVTIVGGGA